MTVPVRRTAPTKQPSTATPVPADDQKCSSPPPPTPTGQVAAHYVIEAFRPWSLSPTLCTSALGAAVAWRSEDMFSLPVFLLQLAVCVGLQSVANLLNTYFDHKKGFDTREHNADPTLAEDRLTVKQVLILMAGSWLVSGIAGVQLARLAPAGVDPLTLLLFIAGGALIASIYSAPPGLKYIGLGDVGVFAAWSLQTLFSFFVQTGKLSLLPIWRALPLVLHTVAILHANNTRDINNDLNAGGRTLAAVVGLDASVWLYKALVIVPYGLAMVRVLMTNLWYALPLITMPIAKGLVKRFEGRHFKSGVVEDTAKMQLLFGALTCIAEANKPMIPLHAVVIVVMKQMAERMVEKQQQ
ncbi:unnamed protein product [Vitrella brassicaformis CCMP3155]|uniref:1,4-dihydroxy-2-naphthoate octaprenyltransferase n=1 Tax=Vitrella brassicaformis (strain CCMP3155) TaxID=1169540 RepID=A0A0G4E9H1_VITBC|nr:unnamed protein product [Vitrella brassicaformis CCMP3155]|eukprot:CEL92247.1 unnamed protein product [Vitrella brassicaformis CCMP3155]